MKKNKYLFHNFFYKYLIVIYLNIILIYKKTFLKIFNIYILTYNINI